MSRVYTHKYFSISHEERVQILWWYLVVVFSTIIFKYHYLGVIYRGGFSIAIENYLESAAVFEYFKIVCLLFVRNFAEVALFLALLYLVACKLIRIDSKIVITVSSLVIFLAEAANQLSLLNVRSLLSYDSLMVTVDWMKDNPDVASSYISKRNVAYFFMFVILSFVPVLASKVSMKSVVLLGINRLLAPVTVFSILASILLYFSIGMFIKANANIIPFHGYWASVISSFSSDGNISPLQRKIPPTAAMKSEYRDFVYPIKGDSNKQRGKYVLSRNIDKKHIVIVSLETAPQKYYPIVNNPELKTLYRMSRNAIVTDLHYTGSPFTQYSTYSMLTGMYVPHNGIPILYGKMHFDGLANVLPEHGYIPTYIDSYYVDWHKGNKNHRVVDSYGFKRVIDRGDYDFELQSRNIENEFDKALFAESVSFKRAMESIEEAEAAGTKSLVFMDTIMGHFKWKSRKVDENLSNDEKILKLAGAFDVLLGEFLMFLKERGMENHVIIVVTGDHGLRYHEEYESLDESASDVQIGFNVPMMIYAPGLIQKQVVLDYVTSHVDLTPTLLELIGIDISQYFYHGENMVDPILKDRLVFMLNQHLKPENSFYWKGSFYTHNYLSGETFVARYRDNDRDFNSSNYASKADSEKELDPVEVLEKADALFSDSVASFLQRKSRHIAVVIDGHGE